VIFRDLSFANSEHFSTLIVIKKNESVRFDFWVLLAYIPHKFFCSSGTSWSESRDKQLTQVHLVDAVQLLCGCIICFVFVVNVATHPIAQNWVPAASNVASSAKRKPGNDPNRPKRPTSAYFYFVQLEREEAAKRGEKITRVCIKFFVHNSLCF